MKGYSRMVPSSNEEESIDIVDDGTGGDTAEAKKKAKAPNMNRLLKTRLLKLIEKTDETFFICLSVSVLPY
jgi:hypothetical protein